MHIFRLLATVLTLISVVVSAPVEASRIFRAGQQQFLKGIDPSVASAASCTFPTSGLSKIIELDPADTAKIFTTIAGSTNPADGDPVGRWVDKNGSYAFTAAADDGTRPTWRYNGGKPYVEFDGTDDLLLNTSASMGIFGNNTQASTVGVATRAVAAAQGVIWAETHSTGNSNYYTMRQDVTDFNDTRAWLRQDGGGYLLNNELDGDEILPTNTDASVITIDNLSDVKGYLDNTLVGTTAAYGRSGTITISQSMLGGRKPNGGAASNWYNGRIYYFIAYANALGSTDRGTLDTGLKCTQGR